jgi:hypothetical protein
MNLKGGLFREGPNAGGRGQGEGDAGWARSKYSIYMCENDIMKSIIFYNKLIKKEQKGNKFESTFLQRLWKCQTTIIIMH